MHGPGRRPSRLASLAPQGDGKQRDRLRCQALLRYICDAIGRYADGPRTARLRRHPRHLSCSTPTARARATHLNMFCMSLMKAENRKAFKENEAKYLDEVPAADARADARRSSSASTTAAGARRQHLFHRQARRDRRPPVPASRRGDDRLDPAGLRRPDAARRPLGRRQPQQVGQGGKAGRIGRQNRQRPIRKAKAKPSKGK